MPLPPEDLVKKSLPGSPSRELLSWAEKEGLHLIGMKFKPGAARNPYYAFQPVGMKVWRIDNSRYDNLADRAAQIAQNSTCPKLWEGPIASVNERSGAG